MQFPQTVNLNYLQNEMLTRFSICFDADAYDLLIVLLFIHFQLWFIFHCSIRVSSFSKLESLCPTQFPFHGL